MWQTKDKIRRCCIQQDKKHRFVVSNIRVSYMIFTVPPNQPMGAQQCNSYIQLSLGQWQEKHNVLVGLHQTVMYETHSQSYRHTSVHIALTEKSTPSFTLFKISAFLRVLFQLTILPIRQQNYTLSSPSYNLTPRCWITNVSFISKSPFDHENRSILKHTLNLFSIRLLRSMYVYFLYAVQNPPDTEKKHFFYYI